MIFHNHSMDCYTNATYWQADETVTNFSVFTAASTAGKVLRITRDIRNEFGDIQQKVEIIEDARVIQEYLKRRHAKEIYAKKLVPQGDIMRCE